MSTGWLSAREVGERLDLTAKGVKLRNERDPDLEANGLSKKLPDGQWLFSEDLVQRWEKAAGEKAAGQESEAIPSEKWREALEFSEAERQHERDRVHQLELLRAADENTRLRAKVATLEHQVFTLAQLLGDSVSKERSEGT